MWRSSCARKVGCTFDLVALRCEKFQTERIRRFVVICTILVEETFKGIAVHPRLSELNIHSRDFSCQSKRYLRLKRTNHFTLLHWKDGVVLGVIEGGDFKDDRRRTDSQNIPIQDWTIFNRHEFWTALVYFVVGISLRCVFHLASFSCWGSRLSELQQILQRLHRTFRVLLVFFY